MYKPRSLGIWLLPAPGWRVSLYQCTPHEAKAGNADAALCVWECSRHRLVGGVAGLSLKWGGAGRPGPSVPPAPRPLTDMMVGFLSISGATGTCLGGGRGSRWERRVVGALPVDYECNVQVPFHWNLALVLIMALFETLPVLTRLTEELGAPNLNSCGGRRN